MVQLKSVWFITHDEHIDRRIYFFTDVFQDMGCQVKLFASLAKDEIVVADPSFVCRPEKTLDIINLMNQPFKKISEIEDLAIRNALHDVCLTQEMYHKKHYCYADNMEELYQLGLGKSEEMQYVITGSNSVYMIAMNRISEGIWYIYNNVREMVNVEILNNNELVHEVKKIVNFITKKLIEDPKIKLTCTSDLFAIGYEPINQLINIALRAQGSHYKLRVSQTGSMEKISYDTWNGDLSTIEAYPVSNQLIDEVNGRQFDYRKFKKYIFEYSPILSSVKLELEKSHPDVVYVADLPTLPIGIMLKEITGCQLIVDCHEWWKEQSVLWEPQNTSRIQVIDEYEKQLYAKCDIRITVGKQLASKMTGYFSSPFDTIYSCLSKNDQDILTLHKDNQFWNNEIGIPLNNKVAVFQGSITSLRNLDNLARSTKFLDEDQCLVIIGGGHYEEEFFKILKNEGDPSKVFFKGWVDQNQLIQFTKQADLGILPYVSLNAYYSLSVPNKFLEYYNAQIPILCDSSLVEISGIVKRFEVGIAVDCSDPYHMGIAIRDFLREDERLSSCRSQYTIHGDQLSYHSQQQQLISIIESLVISS